MKFGLLMVPAVRKGQPEVFDQMMEQIELAEELGYDAVWLTEHHFSEYGRPAVPALAGHVIARTRRMNVNTAVVVLPFHHPLRVAEDWAVLDHLAKGRLEVGIGRGNQPNEFAGFGVSMDEARERAEEALAIIRRAWTEESFSYDGRFWSFPEVEVVPKPYQKPHPPLWQAAVSQYTVQMIVNQGINGLIGPYLCPFEILKREFFDVWHESAETAGRPDLQMAHNEFVYVGESDTDVKKDVEEAIMWYIRKAAKIWGERDRSKVVSQFSNYNEVLEYFDIVQFDEVYENLAILGTPDRVSEKIRWLRDEGGCHYLMNFTWFGGIDHAKAMRSIELFAKEVMPQFREQAVPAGVHEG